MNDRTRTPPVRQTALFSLVGLGGALLAHRWDIPAGLMIGPMLAVLLLKLADSNLGQAPRMFGETGKILLGTFVGATFNRAALAQLGDLLLPTVLATVFLIGSGVCLAWLLSQWTELDMATALFSLTPGGIQEMVAVCEESGADVATVTVLQFLRYLSVLVLVPAMVGWLFS